jgi:hypothetical protein
MRATPPASAAAELMKNPKSRRPKTEGNPKPESPMMTTPGFSGLLQAHPIRASEFGLDSAFGLRGFGL